MCTHTGFLSRSNKIGNAGSPECPVVVVTDSVHQVSVGPGSAAYGSVPTVPDPPVYVSCVKHFKVEVHLEEILHSKEINTLFGPFLKEMLTFVY